MVSIVRHKPVAYILEKREPLHLRKTTEVDIRALFLHLLHLLEALLHLFHTAFLCVRMQYIL